MSWKLPGTVIEIQKEEAENLENLFRPVFLGGGIMLSQVSAITGLEPYMIQNWVKRGFLSNPVQKRYTQSQLGRILNINTLRSILPMEEICGLLTYINGQLDDESDDLIDDAALYFRFVRIAVRLDSGCGREEREKRIQEGVADYRESVPGSRKRVEAVLRVMLTAWQSAQLRREAEELLQEIRKQKTAAE